MAGGLQKNCRSSDMSATSPSHQQIGSKAVQKLGTNWNLERFCQLNQCCQCLNSSRSLRGHHLNNLCSLFILCILYVCTAFESMSRVIQSRKRLVLVLLMLDYGPQCTAQFLPPVPVQYQCIHASTATHFKDTGDMGCQTVVHLLDRLI